jgi:hypothetical protein
MRLSTIYLASIICVGLLFVLMACHTRMAQSAAETGWTTRIALVKDLQLTDLALCTEARYTRHPAMADRHAPFQDHPVALEHFPSGALLLPPAHLARPHAPTP